MYRADEQVWQQKSRVKWLKEGDRNTKFFHLMVSYRRKVNTIDKLYILEREVDSLWELKQVVADHFESHFHQT